MADRDLQKEFDALKKDLGALRGDLASLVDQGGDVAAEARRKLEEEVRDLKSRIGEGAAAVKEKGVEMVGAVEDSISDRPLTSVLTAAGVGFLVGWLLGKK